VSRLVALLCVVLAAKITLVLARGPAPIAGDAAVYWDLSTAVLRGDWLLWDQPVAFRTPGYPWFVAACRAAADDGALAVIVIAQGVLVLVAVFAAAFLALEVSGRKDAFVVTALAMLPPLTAVTYAATLLSETLFTALLMVHLLAVARYAARATAGRAAAAGLTFAAALLTRPVIQWLWVAHLLFLVGLFFAIRRRDRKADRAATDRVDSVASSPRLAGHFAIAAGIVALLVGPWLFRNGQLFGRPFVTEFVGRNVWVVTFQPGSGSGFDLPDTPAANDLRARLGRVAPQADWRRTWQVARGLVRSGMDDAAADRLMKRVAWDAIRNRPAAFAGKAFRRTVNVWRCAATELPETTLQAMTPSSTAADGGPYRGQRTWRFGLRPTEWWIDHRWSLSVTGNTLLTIVIGLATLAVIAHRPTRWHGVWFVMTLSYFTVVTGLIEIPNVRYRIVMEPLAATAIGCGWAAASVYLASFRTQSVARPPASEAT